MRKLIIALMVAAIGLFTASGALAETPKGKILVLLSSENVMALQDGKTEPTGYYLNEFGVPADRFLKAGYELVLATPKGNAPSVDKKSVDPAYFGGDRAEMARIEKVIAGLPGIDDTLSLGEAIDGGLDQYQAVFIPGGHAPLIDLVNNPQVGEILRHFHLHQKPTAAICHGPIALLAAQADPVGYESGQANQSPVAAKDWIYDGYRMTIFSNPEEAVFESSLNGAKLRYYPANAMAAAGGDMQFAGEWQPNVVVDRELITGQNPFSDTLLAEAVLEQLSNP
uniref:type 1 glutamine amidotransferase domain-containing protein n=1 Tax=Microbulbifer agarilyticus TaxID=260552 RepID=UPI000255B802|nr:type 1 glutamine amidotransferase domain-containing protein [Microbulbifer agarilyticus]